MKVETSRFYDNELDKICNVVWQVDGIPFYQKEIILPSGFVEVIFNLSAEVKYQYGKYEKFNLVPKFFINGINTIPISLTPQGHHAFFGIQLYPFALKSLFNIPAYKITNEAIELNEIFPNAQELWYKLIEVDNFSKRKQIVFFELKNLLEKNKKKCEMFCFINALHFLLSNKSTISEMAKLLNISSRQLHRKALEFLGTNPEYFIKYHRFVNSVKLINQNKNSLTEIAYLCKYFDQSHFIRDFKHFSNLTPLSYLNERKGANGHIYF